MMSEKNNVNLIIGQERVKKGIEMDYILPCHYKVQTDLKIH